ncbi:dienelactone hydrolase family protein [Salinifilum ghardaiensis]
MPTELIEHHHRAHGPANRRRRVLRTAAPLFVRFPEGTPRAGAIVLHDVCGLTESVEEHCRSLARLGCVVVAPFLYYETGGKEFRPENTETARAAMELLAAEDLAADLTAAADHLRERVGVRVGATAVLGFGMGGHLATWAAAVHEFAAAVAHEPLGVETAPWRGAPSVAEALSELRSPWLGFAPPENPRPLLALTEDVVVPARDAEHGWWEETVRFLDAHLR